MTTPISNYEFYNGEMSKAMLDKLFFFSKVDADIFVDFGCADGTMIGAMSKLFPEHEYIGYDTDEEMIKKAKWNQITSTTLFFNDWQEVIDCLNPNRKSCLILSSVLHEIYSYEDEDGIELFWNRVFNSGFEYIVIRDMGIDPSFEFETYSDIENLKAKFNPDQLAEFQNIWGPVENKKNLIHFLLKYRYIDNWSREVRENYFSYKIYQPELFALSAGYIKTYDEYFSVPFIRRQIQNDFDWIMNEPTHYKMIWEKN